jgi:hypothetical protein
MTTDSSVRRILVVLGALAVVLVGVAVVLALRPVPQLAADSPEGTVQRYFQAVLDGDDDLAFDHLTEALRARCDGGGIRRLGLDDARVVITRTEVEGALAEVGVEITETYGEGPFGVDSHSFDEILVLERHGERWLITESPWPVGDCPQEDR